MAALMEDAVTATLWLERAEKHNPILPTPGSKMLAAVAEEMEEYADRKVAEFARAHSEPRPVAGEPVAWAYRLATAVSGDGTYWRWDKGPRLSWEKPTVPEGSIRDMTPLYAATHSPAPTEAGEVRVPIKPTQAMREAATEIDIDTIVSAPTRLNWEEADAIYAAMLAAAPSTQGGAEG